jgi:riboflavin transporter FmnP
MRYFLVLYTCICWIVPLVSAYAMASSYGEVSPVILAVQVVSVVAIPVNYYFLSVVYVAGAESRRDVTRAVVMLCVVTAVLAFWAFRLWPRNDYWMYWMLPAGLLLTIFLLVRTLTIKNEPD